MDVSLASQVQKVPHVGWPHIEPVKSEIKEKVKPIGAMLLAIKVNILVLKTNEINPQMPITAKICRASHDAGTWTYIILTVSPCK